MSAGGDSRHHRLSKTYKLIVEVQNSFGFRGEILTQTNKLQFLFFKKIFSPIICVHPRGGGAISSVRAVMLPCVTPNCRILIQYGRKGAGQAMPGNRQIPEIHRNMELKNPYFDF